MKRFCKINTKIIIIVIIACLVLAACDKEEVYCLLTPDEADLTYADNIIIETLDGMTHLSNWGRADEVKFELSVPRTGNYAVTLFYSRAVEDGSDVNIQITCTGSYIEGALPDTGSWSEYKAVTLNDVLNFTSTDDTIYICGDMYQDNEYIINLRSIKLTYVSK